MFLWKLRTLTWVWENKHTPRNFLVDSLGWKELAETVLVPLEFLECDNLASFALPCT